MAAATNSLRSASDRFGEMLYGDQLVSAGFGLDSQALRVDSLGSEAERAGLRKGDTLVGVDGHPIRGFSDVLVPVGQARTGDHLLLRVKRTSPAGQAEQNISVPLLAFTYVGYAPGSVEYLVRSFSAS